MSAFLRFFLSFTMIFQFFCIFLYGREETVSQSNRHVEQEIRALQSEIYSREEIEAVLEALGEKTHPLLLSRLHELDHPLMEEILYQLFEASDEEMKLINALFDHFDIRTGQLREILNGAHVILLDHGEFYHLWKSEYPNTPRSSSHFSFQPQFSIKGSVVSEMLVGTRPLPLTLQFFDPEKGPHTWFQLERSEITGFSSFLAHMKDYFWYIWSGKQQGPFGSSPYTDKEPMILFRNS